MMDSVNIPSILAIDVGTSALKAVLFTAAGRVLATEVRPYTYRIPQPDWGEADPEQWWTALVEALAGLRQAGFDLVAVQVLGLTGQMHTAVLLDEADRPLSPTILWLDRRAAAETAELQVRLKLPPYQLNSTFTLPKLLWLARHQPEVLAQTRLILWPKDYLRYRLTGRALTDVTEAAGAALLDWEQRAWAVDRLSLANLSATALPPLAAAGDDAGPLLPAAAAALGLPPGLKVIVGAGDVMALMGTAPPRPGRFACSLGSSAMISCLVEPDRPPADPAHRLYIYPFLPYRLLNGVLSTSGASLTWAWQALYEAQTPLAEILPAAQAIPPGAEGLIYLPFLAGERCPYWNDQLRGGFYGLTLAHTRPHMVRAVLEGVAYSLRHLLDISAEMGVPVQEVALAGGGATVPGWPQIVADVCRRTVSIYAGRETVTRPLYAYCLTAVDQTISFDQALDQTFEPPDQLAPRPELAEIYEFAYRRYRLLADFVAQI
ncbi:MAG: FGGY family carbohydrate kinase [Chloroflexota bacterium]